MTQRSEDALSPPAIAAIVIAYLLFILLVQVLFSS